MNVVTMREPVDHIHIDLQVLGRQIQKYTTNDQDMDIFSLADAMAQALGAAESHFLNRNPARMGDVVEKVIELSVCSGFSTLYDVAQDVKTAMTQNDHVAVSSTLHRLLRIGEKSLYAIWEMPEQFV